MNLEPKIENAENKDELKQYICDACRQFYSLGWVSGTGGGMSIRIGDTALLAPSGVEKEKLSAEDIFEVRVSSAAKCADFEIVEKSENPNHKLSECTPLFFAAFNERNAGAVIHSHSMNAFLASRIAQRLTMDSKFSISIQNSLKEKSNAAIAEIRLSKMEMLKGIKGLGYESMHAVPVIANTAKEEDLTGSLTKAMKEYKDTHAVVVANHGAYIWGATPLEAKKHAECYDYLFDAYARLYELSLEKYEF